MSLPYPFYPTRTPHSLEPQVSWVGCNFFHWDQAVLWCIYVGGLTSADVSYLVGGWVSERFWWYSSVKIAGLPKEWTIQRLPHLGFHLIISHQTQTVLHKATRFCWKDSDIAVSCKALPGPGKYRNGCSQSSIGWNTGPPMEELEKVPKELKGSATL